MASTLENIIATIIAAQIVDPATQELIPNSSINYGIVENLVPPYIGVDSLDYEEEYDTCGARIRNCNFSLVVVHKSALEAQNLAAPLLALFDASHIVTPTCMTCYLHRYRIGQALYGPALYQWTVVLEMFLKESI